MLRRAAGRAQAVWTHGALRYDPAAKQVQWQGQPVELTGRELALLEMLLLHPQRVLSRTQLQEKLYDWSGGEPESNALEVLRAPPAAQDPPGHRAHRAWRRLCARRGRRRGMSLQRRLLLYLLICAPVVWGVALLVSADRARHEVNELFDTEIIRLARQVQATLVGVRHARAGAAAAAPSAGEADLRDLAIAVWNAEGQLLLVDREGVQLPRRADATGFVDLQLDGEPWRVYYLQSPRGDWLVAAGQRGRRTRRTGVGPGRSASCCPGCWCCRCCCWPWPGPCGARWRRCAR